MKVFARYKTDVGAELNGAWIAIGDGAELLVARAHNDNHQAALKRLQKPYTAVLNAGGEIPKDKREAMAVEAMVETILLGWRGLQDEDGAEIPYTRENAVRLLTELPDFRATVAEIATTHETFRAEALKAAEGNSEAA